MYNLELRLKELEYHLVTVKEISFGLRSGQVKLFAKSIGYNSYSKVFISGNEIVSYNGVSKKELEKIRGY